MLKPRRDVTRTAAGRLASSEAAATLVTKITVFPKVNLLFALVGNVWFVLWQGCEPYYTGGKSNTMARAPALVPTAWGQQHLAWLLIPYCAGGNKPRPDFIPHFSHCLFLTKTPWTHCTCPDTQKSIEPNGRGQVFYTCSPRMTVLFSLSGGGSPTAL